MIITKFQIPEQSGRTGTAGGSPGALVAFHPEVLVPASVIGRTIDAVNLSFGTYGMGGPGFVAFGLGNEWLVISIWGAGSWLTAEGRPVDDPYFDINGTQPWVSDRDDHFTPRVAGRAISMINVKRTSLDLILDDGFAITVEEDPTQRPPIPRTQETREFAQLQDLRNAVFLCPTTELWV